VTAVTVLAQPRRPGRPPCCPPELAICILQLHRQGLSLQAMSEVLNQGGVATPTGRPHWSKSSVDRLLHTRYVQDIATGHHQRMAAGLATVRAQGSAGGPPAVIDPDQLATARARRQDGGTDADREALGVSRASVSRHLAGNTQ
jgi:hypothetical protein